MKSAWEIVVEYRLTVRPATFSTHAGLWVACTPRYARLGATPEAAVMAFSEFAEWLKASGELETLAPGMGRAL